MISCVFVNLLVHSSSLTKYSFSWHTCLHARIYFLMALFLKLLWADLYCIWINLCLQDVSTICEQLADLFALNLSYNLMAHDMVGLPHLKCIRILVLNNIGINWTQVPFFFVFFFFSYTILVLFFILFTICFSISNSSILSVWCGRLKYSNSLCQKLKNYIWWGIK